VHQDWYPKSYALVDARKSEVEQVREFGGNEHLIEVQEGSESREESPAPQSEGRFKFLKNYIILPLANLPVVSISNNFQL
jgi:hypothetical protein